MAMPVQSGHGLKKITNQTLAKRHGIGSGKGKNLSINKFRNPNKTVAKRRKTVAVSKIAEKGSKRL